MSLPVTNWALSLIHISEPTRQANFFAADLLLDDEEVLDLIHSGNTYFFSVAKELCIPAPFFAFKMYSLIRRGEHSQLPVDIDNHFLRAKH